MSSAWLVVAPWTAVGAIAGALLSIATRRLLLTEQAGPLTARPVGPALTAILFGVLAWRFGGHVDLLPYSCLAAVGIALAIIDTIEQRLPSILLLHAGVVIGALLAASAIFQTSGSNFVRALAGMAILAAFYLVLALVSGGGLGAGDVKLGGILGLALAWQSWLTLLAGTLLGWLLAAVVRAALTISRRMHRETVMPLGPYLLLGALAAVLIPVG
jgi:leader peptidase (prepilin peptidase)/N-methyltransferase